MWGVRCGPVELEEGDMLKSAKVDALMREADVVLVNNKVFLESREFFIFIFIFRVRSADVGLVRWYSERGAPS